MSDPSNPQTQWPQAEINSLSPRQCKIFERAALGCAGQGGVEKWRRKKKLEITRGGARITKPMPNFLWSGKTPSGEDEAEEVTAETPAEARKILEARGWTELRQHTLTLATSSASDSH